MSEEIKEKHWYDFFGKLLAFWKRNLDENYKAVSIGFGILLVVVLTSLIPPVSALMKGSVPDWGTFGTTSFTALIMWLTLLSYSFFGKKGQNGGTPNATP